MSEQARLLGKTESLVGVLTKPPSGSPQPRVGVIVLNAGIVHRVGPGRLYVKLSRRLAAQGLLVMRYDGSGIGDSEPRRDNIPYDKATIVETVEVMNHMAEQHGIERFLLVGICSGAITSFKTACLDQRVAGIAMMNPQGFYDAAAWKTHVESRGWAQDYWRKLINPESWLKALTGKTQYRRLISVVLYRVKNRFKKSEVATAVADSLATYLSGLIERRAGILLIASKGDSSQDYMSVIMGARAKTFRESGLLEEEIIDGADHTFTELVHQEQVLKLVEAWAARTASS